MKTHPMCKDCHYLHHEYWNCQGEENGCFEWHKPLEFKPTKNWQEEADKLK